jgi:hypothetical protein
MLGDDRLFDKPIQPVHVDIGEQRTDDPCAPLRVSVLPLFQISGREQISTKDRKRPSGDLRGENRHQTEWSMLS